MRRISATMLPVALALVLVGCESSDGARSDAYWDGYKVGHAEGQSYAERVVNDTSLYCNTRETLPPGWEFEEGADPCTKVLDTSYPRSAGERYCGGEMPSDLNRDERAVWHKGCMAGVTREAPDTVEYGPQPE